MAEFNVHSSQTGAWLSEKLRGMTSQSVARVLEEFLAGSNGAVVLEDGSAIFDLSQSKFSVSGEANKCLLHFWSEERNIVRRVLDVENKGETLRVTVQKLGQQRPAKLDICRERDRRTVSGKRAVRVGYQRLLQRVLRKKFPDLVLAELSTAVDLEKSFGPIYARGLLLRGQSGFAVFGVNRQELQGSIDAAVTFGILWLDVCRKAHAGRAVIEGLKLFVPAGCSALLRTRMAHLDRAAAKWELYELEERDEELSRIELLDRGNIATRLVHCSDEEMIHSRFQGPISLVQSIMPEADIAAISPRKLPLAVMAWNLRAHASHLSPGTSTFRNWCLELAQPSDCWTTTVWRLFKSWFGILAKSVILMGRGNAVGGGCIRSAGWSLWW